MKYLIQLLLTIAFVPAFSQSNEKTVSRRTDHEAHDNCRYYAFTSEWMTESNKSLYSPHKHEWVYSVLGDSLGIKMQDKAQHSPCTTIRLTYEARICGICFSHQYRYEEKGHRIIEETEYSRLLRKKKDTPNRLNTIFIGHQAPWRITEPTRDTTVTGVQNFFKSSGPSPWRKGRDHVPNLLQKESK